MNIMLFIEYKIRTKTTENDNNKYTKYVLKHSIAVKILCI
jgi:hypothetical protein